MRLKPNFSWAITVGKAFKSAGITAAAVGGSAAVAYLLQPEVIVALSASTGPYAFIVAPALAFGLKAAWNALQHVEKRPEED